MFFVNGFSFNVLATVFVFVWINGLKLVLIVLGWNKPDVVGTLMLSPFTKTFLIPLPIPNDPSSFGKKPFNQSLGKWIPSPI
jgi:hypothetical protein